MYTEHRVVNLKGDNYMREGILEQLPTTLPKDKVVLVFGHDNIPGGNTLKRLIDDLNRGEEWIRAEFKPTSSTVTVSTKAAVVLTMFGIGHGPLSRIRKASEGICCCPNQALTVSEVKEALSILEKVRKGETGGMEYRGSQNGNSTYSMPGKSEGQRLDEIGDTARHSAEEFLSAARQEPTPLESAETETEPYITHSQSDVDSALKTLEKFSGSMISIVEEAQLAVMVVGDELKNMTARYVDLQVQLGLKEKEIAELRDDFGKANKRVVSENAATQEENKKLKAENARLQKTLSSLGDLIKGAQK